MSIKGDAKKKNKTERIKSQKYLINTFLQTKYNTMQLNIQKKTDVKARLTNGYVMNNTSHLNQSGHLLIKRLIQCISHQFAAFPANGSREIEPAVFTALVTYFSRNHPRTQVLTTSYSQPNDVDVPHRHSTNRDFTCNTHILRNSDDNVSVRMTKSLVLN